MNRSRVLPRIAGAFAAAVLALTTLTGCPTVAVEDGEDGGDGEEEDMITYSLVR